MSSQWGTWGMLMKATILTKYVKCRCTLLWTWWWECLGRLQIDLVDIMSLSWIFFIIVILSNTDFIPIIKSLPNSNTTCFRCLLIHNLLIFQIWKKYILDNFVGRWLEQPTRLIAADVALLKSRHLFPY